jgi:hypothetical protein
VTTYWIGRTAVVEWPLVDIEGTPVDTATVTGTVTLPDGSTAPMDVAPGIPYRLAYAPTLPGLHAYRAEATGTVGDAVEGTFVVLPHLVAGALITTDPTTDLGRVRLLISDVDTASPTFTDAEISAFLALEGGNVRLAAAQALDTIASNEALVSKQVRTMDVSTNGPAVAAELRARARALREQADRYDADGDPFAMDVIEYPGRRDCGYFGGW